MSEDRGPVVWGELSRGRVVRIPNMALSLADKSTLSQFYQASLAGRRPRDLGKANILLVGRQCVHQWGPTITSTLCGFVFSP